MTRQQPHLPPTSPQLSPHSPSLRHSSRFQHPIRYNHSLTIAGIPPETYNYRLGNRSALEWVIDQYRVSTDPRSNIHTDPNNPDDPDYSLRLIAQVVHISLQTTYLNPKQFATRTIFANPQHQGQ